MKNKNVYLLALLVVASVFALAACGKPKPHLTTLPSPYRFELGQVSSQIPTATELPHRINGAVVAGGLIQRLNGGLFATHLAQLDVALMHVNMQVLQPNAAAPDGAEQMAEPAAADYAMPEDNDKLWSFNDIDWSFEREHAMPEHQLDLTLDLRANYLGRPLLSQQYQCSISAPRGIQYLEQTIARLKESLLAEGNAEAKLWQVLLEGCLDDVAQQFLTDVAVAR